MFRRVRFCREALPACVAFVLAGGAAAQPATRLVDVAAGPSGSYPFGFQELSGAAFFFASSIPFSSSDLWRTDGTGAGTAHVFQTSAGAFSGMAATSRKLFWLEGSIGPAGPCGICPPPWLVASDGTQAGTAPVPGPSGPVVYAIGAPVAALESVFVMGTEVLGIAPPYSLWRADGTGSALSLGPFPNGSFGPLVALHDRVLFLVAPLAGGFELWRSDGSPPGSSRITVLSSLSSVDCSGFGLPRRLGRSVVLFADDGKTGCNLWRSDGTGGGTLPVALFGGGSSAGIFPFGSSRGALVFANNNDLWRTDGTAAGTILLKTFPTGYALGTMAGAGTREGVYFPVSPTGLLSQLWLTNGKAGGTILVHDFQANGENARIDRLATANGRLLMSVADAVTGALSLWTSDGTPAGTVPVQQNVGAIGPGFPVRGVTLFEGTDPGGGPEPWAMDGGAFSAQVPPTSLSLVTPCRMIDTRLPTGFLGGPALLANAPRVFPVGEVCGIPWTARALAANVTVTGATSDGLLRAHAADIGAPVATVINFRAGQTRANNATIALSGDGEFTVRYETPTATGAVHVIVDVVGWYE